MKIPTKWIKEYIDLPQDLKVFTDKMSMIGHLLDKTEVIETDTVIDLELRGNRADCYGILGIARESHAAFGGRLEIPKVEKLPFTRYSGFELILQSPTVHRFYSVIIRGLKVGPSPEWMKERLHNYGMDSINNIVDITNYVMIETGMPMHAFDLSRMGGNKLILRNASEGETFITFDGTEKKLTTQDTVFAGEDGRVMGIAGVIGSKDSGIQNDTVDILLECAGYDRVAIRKSIFNHNIHTEAGLRHSHDLSSSLCDYALERAADLIIQLAGDGDYKKIEGINDQYPKTEIPKVIDYAPSEVIRLGGVKIQVSEQAEILKRLEFEVDIQGPNQMRIKVPLFRTDIFESADIVEEVLRIYGYEKIPSTTLSSVIPDPIIQPELVIEEKARDIFVSQGLHEVITVPMAKLEDLQKTLDYKTDKAIALINPSSSDHTHLRTNMYTGLLQATQRILDRGDESIEIFEIGKVYFKDSSISLEQINNGSNENMFQNKTSKAPHKEDFPYLEERRMAAVLSSKGNKKWDFYSVKGLLEEYFDQMNLKNIEYMKFDHEMCELAASVCQGDKVLGNIGLLKKEITEKNYDIKWDVFVFQLHVDLLTSAEYTNKSYLPYSIYPEVSFDLSVYIDISVRASDVKNLIKQTGGEIVRSVSINDVFESGGKRSLLLNIIYQSKERTLTLDEVNQIHINIENSVRSTFKAVIRGRDDVGKSDSKKSSYSVKRENNIPKIEENITTGELPMVLPLENNLSRLSEELTKPVNQFIVIGRILSIEKHPNADRLVICKVDIGKVKPAGTLFEDSLQIVTGAGNILSLVDQFDKSTMDLIVPVALPGAKIKSHKTGETIQIKISELRGIVSEGMLCSSNELEFPNPGYEGILILDEKYSDKIGAVLTQ